MDTPTEIKDIFEGRVVNAWSDGDLYMLQICNVTISIDKEGWKQVVKELKRFS